MKDSKNENLEQRASRILSELTEAYPGKNAYDLDGRGLHFLCEVEPVSEHPEYDIAVEVIISSKPHKHLKMTQTYRILKGTLTLYYKDEVIILNTGDTYIIEPDNIHWAESSDEAWVEMYSVPGWTKEDHIIIE